MAPAASGPAVGLVGCGRWGGHILRDLLAIGCRVVVADPCAASRARASAAGASATIADAAALPVLAGIVVATPTSTHAAVLDTLLPRRVPLFCEKPLTADAASAARLAAAAGDRLFVMDKWRYHPGVEALREVARSVELGPVRGLRTTRHGWANPHSDVDAVWILAPHDLSIGLEILGALPAARCAVGERLHGRAVGLLAVLGEDPWMVVDVSVATPVVRREVRLHCRDGVAVLPGAYSDHLLVSRPDGSSERRPLSSVLPLRRELQTFVEHLEGGPPPKSPAADGAALVDALQRLRRLAGLDGDGAGA